MFPVTTQESNAVTWQFSDFVVLTLIAFFPFTSNIPHVDMLELHPCYLSMGISILSNVFHITSKLTNFVLKVTR